ncbi:two-component system response regulator [Streptomyces sp. NPDC048650]|uniref:response regulator n=1 Tax=unclassified Streptomyces TaxID=2593676 RepID=UPI0037233589
MTHAPDSTASILIVDDMEENLVALEAVLGSLSRRVVRARSGEEALKAMLREEFAVVLIDVMMPGMNGFETAANIKGLDQTKDVPVILLTGAAVDPNYAYRGYTVGAADFLIKPFDPWLLRTKVNVFLELHRKNVQLAAQADQLTRLLTSDEDAHGAGEAEGAGHVGEVEDTGGAGEPGGAGEAAPPAAPAASPQPAQPVETVELPDGPPPRNATGPPPGTDGPPPPEQAPAATPARPAQPPLPPGQDAVATTAPGEAARLAEIAGRLTQIEVLLRNAEDSEADGLANRIAELEQAVGHLLMHRGR